MVLKIKIQTRMVYGRPLHYPMCEVSELLVKLGRPRKNNSSFCFADRDLTVLRRLGYEIEQMPQFESR